jgi:HEPN domain-containing protein
VSKAPAPDIQRMIDTATAFFPTGERCAPDLKFGRYGSHSVDAPRIVAYAFAVELALKLLSCLSNQTQKRGHSLEVLFDDLPTNLKVRLQYLEGCVEEIDKYFENWRYPFESEFLIGECDNPRRAFIECHREIRNLKPNLMSVYEKNWGSFDPDWDWAWPELEVAQIERSAAL